jgi:undecaprenyl-diphosphatase
VNSFDDAATAWINGFAGQVAWIDGAMKLITLAGVSLMILAVAASWWLGQKTASRRAERRHLAVRSGLAFLLGLGINQLILLVVHRMRPYDAGISHLLIAPSGDPSFPSDHATASFAIALTYLGQRDWRAGLVLAAGAVMVVTSRVYLGTHYVSDILGGVATALLAVLLVAIAYRPQTSLDRFITSIL